MSSNDRSRLLVWSMLRELTHFPGFWIEISCLQVNRYSLILSAIQVFSAPPLSLQPNPPVPWSDSPISFNWLWEMYLLLRVDSPWPLSCSSYRWGLILWFLSTTMVPDECPASSQGKRVMTQSLEKYSSGKSQLLLKSRILYAPKAL